MSSLRKNIHAIYVRNSDSENLVNGLSKGVWGFRDNKSSIFRSDMNRIKEGDLILFAYSMSVPDGGNIRNKFDGKLSQYILCRATSDKYDVTVEQNESNPPIWKEEIHENIFLHRFTFNILASYPILIKRDDRYLLSETNFSIKQDSGLENLYEAMRLSTCRGCRNVPLDNINIMTENFSQENLLTEMSKYFQFNEAYTPKSEDKTLNKKKYHSANKPSSLKKFEDEMDDQIDKNRNVVSDIEDILNRTKATSAKRERLINARIGQGKYRKTLLKSFREMCPLTGIKHSSLLVASHIKAWHECDSDDERVDPLNGLLLSVMVDKLFDKYFITFDPQTLNLVSCGDELIDQILEDMELGEFTLDLSGIYKKPEKINKVKFYLESHFSKFKAINEKRYAI